MTMTARGEGLPRAPRVYTLEDQAQLLRRWRYATSGEMGLPENVRAGLALWQRPDASSEPWMIQHTFRNLAAALIHADVPEALPRNAAAPPPRRA
jgi:hypothetical protein